MKSSNFFSLRLREIPAAKKKKKKSFNWEEEEDIILKLRSYGRKSRNIEDF